MARCPGGAQVHSVVKANDVVSDIACPQWQRVLGATAEQIRHVKSKVEALESVNNHGLIKKQRQTASIVGDESIGSEPLLVQTTTNQNAVAKLYAGPGPCAGGITSCHLQHGSLEPEKKLVSRKESIYKFFLLCLDTFPDPR